MNFKKYLVPFILIIFIGCESTEVVETELPFEEKIVINAELYAGRQFDGVSISRTIPLTGSYRYSEALVTDASVKITDDRGQERYLFLDSLGRYSQRGLMTIHSGYTYYLEALIDGEHYTAETRVPYAPQVANIEFAEESYITARVTGSYNQVYSAVWVLLDNFGREMVRSDKLYTVKKISSQDSDVMDMRTANFPETYNQAHYRNRLRFLSMAFDSDYYEYFITRNSNNPVENTFSQSGGVVKWNVTGPKAIGLFIGVAEGTPMSPER